jgi:murein DD-endopeptidase MepM/ murein hydrolase activator NlpD
MTAGAHARSETILDGKFMQGGLVIGSTTMGATVTLNGRAVRVAPDGGFVFGFSRDAALSATLKITTPGGVVDRHVLKIKARTYDIQRIDGLPRKMVSPPAKALARIRREGAAIKAARMRDTPVPYFQSGFIWPAKGRISGVYGSQRVFNGKPKRPHYGIDIAGPIGTPVVAPADGVVRLAELDLYYSGGTIILDHGQGLSSAFLHMETVAVKPGDMIRQGDPLGTIGATGRATGPHLDWRINWFERRLDAGLLVPPMR